MPKYSTDSNGDDSSDSDEPTKQIRINISEWLKEALDQVVQQSDVGAREAIRRPLEYAIIQWNRDFERDNEAFDVPGQHIWEPEFRCIECKSANKFLFRELLDKDESCTILCLNCEHNMSKEEVRKLSRAAEIQDMEPYTLEKEGTEIRHEYEGKFRTPMRFECRECKTRELILPDPDDIDSLICPRCGNEGRIINQVQGPVASGFEKYPPDRYHNEPTPEPVGRGISAGEYDQLEKTYRDAYER
jgi:DNA-directed RNA polymerase subunit M/transcription elongation factor TFIIS